MPGAGTTAGAVDMRLGAGDSPRRSAHTLAAAEHACHVHARLHSARRWRSSQLPLGAPAKCPHAGAAGARNARGGALPRWRRKLAKFRLGRETCIDFSFHILFGFIRHPLTRSQPRMQCHDHWWQQPARALLVRLDGRGSIISSELRKIESMCCCGLERQLLC